LSVCPGCNVCLPVCLSFWLAGCLSVRLSVCLSACTVCLSICLYFYLSVCLSACLSVSISLYFTNFRSKLESLSLARVRRYLFAVVYSACLSGHILLVRIVPKKHNCSCYDTCSNRCKLAMFVRIVGLFTKLVRISMGCLHPSPFSGLFKTVSSSSVALLLPEV
jgi:hypothetical protein